MKNTNASIGKRGENAACRYLEQLGHIILERNWRYAHLELDIISKTPGSVHIVEVKTRVAPAMAMPEENVGPLKRDRLVRAANAYLHSRQKAQLSGDDEIFFDVVSVLIEGDTETIEYFSQAFVPIYV